MGRSVSYPSEALVVTFSSPDYECETCNGTGQWDDPDGEEGNQDCPDCDGHGYVEMTELGFDELVDNFRARLKELFPSVENADDWIDREDHVLAENRLARFGISEYCGLVSYWIVPNEPDFPRATTQLATRWIRSIADKFVAAFGELSKVGSMSNGEGVYRRIDK